MAADDPFACFGGDDSDSDESDVDAGFSGGVGGPIHQRSNGDDGSTSTELNRARDLVEAYNANKDRQTSSNLESPAAKPPEAEAFRSSGADQRSRTSALPWPHRPPLYLGPMSLRDELKEGGGRGYVASRDLPAGTCVLIEEPIVEGWSEEQVGKRLGLESIEYTFGLEDARRVVGCIEELHPTRKKVESVCQNDEKISDDDSAEIELLDRIQILDLMSQMNSVASHAQQVKTLVAHASVQKITNSDGSPLNERDINRMLLALRYNGFDSGLYLHFAMFNHDEDPNCIKFRPNNGNGNEGGQSKVHYSEARTTRRVKKGEALTLHYLENPREVSHATRRKILWDQHRFDIGDEHGYRRFMDKADEDAGDDAMLVDNSRGNAVYESELVGGMFPPSDREGSVGVSMETDVESENVPAASNIEKSLDDLEDMLVELQALFAVQTGPGDVEEGRFGRAAALELTVWELITASKSALGNDMHVLLSRCRRLHLDVIELLLSRCSSKLTGRQSVELMARFVPSVHSLLESQRRRLGGDHPDVARSYGDLSSGIQALLSRSPKRLLSLKLEGLTTMDECSRLEGRCRAEKGRIEALYPRDADDILESIRKE